MPDVDVAILGGGCSGLSLAIRLAGRGVSFRVVEPRPTYEDDRCWSFWRVAPHPFEDLLSGAWTAWSVEGPRGVTRRQSDGVPYQTLGAKAFYDRARERIEAADGAALTMGVRAETVTPRADGAEIGCSDGSFTATHVIDTRPPRRRPAYGQFFLGREIVTDAPVFDATTVQLMHFRSGYSAGIDFLYVLPFAADRALVEVTSFAPEAPTRAVFEAWLAEEIAALTGNTAHEVLREETGALPMQVGYRDPACPGIARLGLGGGAARPSTGYAFQRIQAQTDIVAAQLAAGDAPSAPSDRLLTSYMDAVFLRVLQRNPIRGPDLLQRLFANSPDERVERFLSGSTHPLDRASVVTSVPPWPFFAASVSLLRSLRAG